MSTRFDSAHADAIRDVRLAILRAITTHTGRVPAWVVLFALVQLAREFLKLCRMPIAEEAAAINTIRAFLAGGTNPNEDAGESSVLEGGGLILPPGVLH